MLQLGLRSHTLLYKRYKNERRHKIELILAPRFYVQSSYYNITIEAFPK